MKFSNFILLIVWILHVQPIWKNLSQNCLPVCFQLSGGWPDFLNAPTQIGIIQNYGLHLGNAYQIIDDVLDFVSHPGLLGKPAGNDLLEGNINLPVIIALEDPIYGPELKPLLQDQITISMNLKKIIRILTESYALDMAIGEARKYLNQARQMLQQLPSGEARDDLFTLSDYLLNNYLQAGISSDYQKNIPETKVWM